jgi:hypothetical protein
MEGIAMPEFRIFTFEKDGRIVTPPAVVTCESEVEAVAKAQALLDGRVIEVWSDERIIVHLDPMHD